jgi:hypothetical protein
LLGHRVLRRRSAEVSAESALRGARASAALESAESAESAEGVEGAALPLEELRAIAGAGDAGGKGAGGAGAEGGGPVAGRADPVVLGALRVSAEIGPLTETWRRAPRQALARLHVLAAAGLAPEDEVGRPRIAGRAAGDPLRLGTPPEPAEVAARLDALSGLLTRPTRAPALVVGAIAHGELLTLRPFGRADGIVARAAQRLTYVARGLDPKSLTAPEVGHAELADEYAAAAGGYAGGTPEGVARWVRHCADAVSLAARDSLAMCEALLRG